MFGFFLQNSSKFQGLKKNGREKFWGRFKRFGKISKLRISGETQLLPADY